MNLHPGRTARPSPKPGEQCVQDNEGSYFSLGVGRARDLLPSHDLTNVIYQVVAWKEEGGPPSGPPPS